MRRDTLVAIGLTLLLAEAGVPCALGAGRSPAVNARVARVIKARRAALVQLFEKRGVSYPPRRVYIRVFKREGVLELWADAGRGAGAKHTKYTKIKSYPICAASGALGPKRRQGDLQVPEGFYRVRVFNPWSAYHLSLGIDYPNRSDRVRGHRANLGGAIMLHGDCVSIGCVAITDALIEEVYLAAAESWHKPVPVHIFPTRLDAAGITWLREHHAARPDLLAFWEELRPGFTHFEQHRTLPRIRVDRDGRYRVSAPRPTPVRPVQAERPGAPTTF